MPRARQPQTCSALRRPARPEGHGRFRRLRSRPCSVVPALGVLAASGIRTGLGRAVVRGPQRFLRSARPPLPVPCDRARLPQADPDDYQARAEDNPRRKHDQVIARHRPVPRCGRIQPRDPAGADRGRRGLRLLIPVHRQRMGRQWRPRGGGVETGDPALAPARTRKSCELRGTSRGRCPASRRDGRPVMAETMLVVEDERKLRELVRSHLERAGFRCRSRCLPRKAPRPTGSVAWNSVPTFT
jgi:hypothetical protein